MVTGKRGMMHAARKKRGLWRANIVRVGIIRIVASDGDKQRASTRLAAPAAACYAGI